ncbi:cation:proton antiporter [Streptomyces sp. NPDC059893]|uniref:cation:proton antiporter domain-containing protein n=1 Tax=Streptomyces sp. NPDC059893 TaxID=3346990 RepID=UPI0036491A00
MGQTGTLILIMAAAVSAPLPAHGIGRWVRIPVVIFELVPGILIGPDVLDWAHGGEIIDVLSNLGLSMLIFLAGYEPTYVLAPRDLSPLGRRALTIYSSTCLPLVVAITAIGVDDGVAKKSEAAALVGAAMISVLVFPLLALRLRARERDITPRLPRAPGTEAW